jgi:enoyl-CoA hydratase/carnithine racemase
VLATDIRFAGDKAIFGQFEVGVGAVPGGAPMARLARLVGRGRALEILLGGDDLPAAVAADYGYVNRVLPDDELDDFVERFAGRIASFDKVALTKIKELVDQAASIPQGEFEASIAAYFQTAGCPEHAGKVRSLFEKGLQQPDGVERDLGKRIIER